MHLGNNKQTNMKRLFFICAAATFIGACNSDSKSGIETTKEVVADTSAQYKNSMNTDTAKMVITPPPVVPAKTTVRKEVKSKASTATKAHSAAAPATTPAPAVNPAETTATTKTETTTPAPAVTPEKKGMSNGAKGAIIGGGAGAIGGAIISKKKGKGAVIGGLLGAGAGYIIGKKKDKNKKDTAQ